MGATTLFSAVAGQVDGAVKTVFVGALGLGILWVGWKFTPLQRFVFDRPSETFTHHVHRLNGAESWERPLSEIRRAADEGHWNEGARLQRVTLLTTDGRHPLESGFSGTSRTRVIHAINEWLGVT
jgi:hypothetical protein